MLEKEYKAWLDSEGYQPGTAHNAILSTLVAEEIWVDARARGEIPVSRFSTYKPLLKRYSRFLHSIPFPRWSEFERFVVDNFEATRPSAVTGPSTKPPLTPAQWQALVSSVCSGEEPADTALCIILSIPELSPVAVLELPWRSFDPAFAERIKPLRKKYRTLGESVSSSGGNSAYKRVQRQLYKHAELLGFEVDFHSIARTPEEVRDTARVA